MIKTQGWQWGVTVGLLSSLISMYVARGQEQSFPSWGRVTGWVSTRGATRDGVTRPPQSSQPRAKAGTAGLAPQPAAHHCTSQGMAGIISMRQGANTGVEGMDKTQ
eukprot:1157847-Pelagomonas_calceolata.AAC.5